ncbi:MAG: type II 3-dehydroquinate dehydratase [Candidatus Omnitrophica bacterium]|nr:type II 3-dehydroquinate dehydratase [Candidatus Omnitrophota bacterium]
MKKVLIIHGPNLHLLGKREPDIYGNFSLLDLNRDLKLKAKKSKIAIAIFQSNSEGEIVEKITNSKYDFLIINPAAYTHTSVAIRDALLGVNKPTLEVHISNIYRREDFRKKSLVSDVVLGIIGGLGKWSYLLALDAAIAFFKNNLSAKK